MLVRAGPLRAWGAPIAGAQQRTRGGAAAVQAAAAQRATPRLGSVFAHRAPRRRRGDGLGRWERRNVNGWRWAATASDGDGDGDGAPSDADGAVSAFRRGLRDLERRLDGPAAAGAAAALEPQSSQAPVPLQAEVKELLSPSATEVAGRPAAVVVAAVLLAGVAALDVVCGAGGLPVLLIGYCTSLVASALVGALALPLLRCLKAGQVVRLDGPPAHILAKSGTPTMGGVSFVPVGVLTALAFTGAAPAVAAVALATLAFAALGAVDDSAKMARKSSAGVSPKGKLAAQLTIAAALCGWVFCSLTESGEAAGWAAATLFNGWALPLGPMGMLYWPLSLFTLTAESNAVNLTDGLDGLAAGTAAVAFVAMSVVVFMRGALAAHVKFELAIFCVCMAGSCAGFLVHNHNKAKMFMGDTGSLALGGALGAVAIAAGPATFLPLLVITTLFALEALSVVLQVGYFKYTKHRSPSSEGQRLFRMAPFHHHLEMGGWSEVSVVQAFYATALLMAALGCLVALA